MNIFVLMNNDLTQEQIDDLADNHGVDEIFYPSDELRNKWANIQPELSTKELKEYLKDIEAWIDLKSFKCDGAIIVGEQTASLIMQNHFLLDFDDTVLLFATTKREVVEEKQDDGSIVKKSIFKHIRFREVTADD